MSPEAFLVIAESEGFAHPVEVHREPDGFLDLHEHPFEAKALILDGEIEIGDACGEGACFCEGEGILWGIAAVVSSGESDVEGLVSKRQ